MGLEWPKQEKSQRTINSKWAQHDKCHLYYLTLTSLLYDYIYMHMDAPFCDVVLVVRTGMRFMMCDMFVLHVDASSLRMVGTWMSLVYFM